jgi:glycosyltransferase involved in cell wall biosynthesis
VHGYGKGTKVERGLAFLRRTIARAKSERWDVVWSLWPDKTGLLAMLASKLLGRPLVLSIMGGEIASLPECGYGSFGDPRLRFVLERLLTRARRTTVGSNPLAERLDAILPAIADRVRVTPLGVPEGRIDGRPRRAWTKGQILRLVAVMTPSPVKRAEALVELVRQLDADGTSSELDLYGDRSGPSARELSARVSAAGLAERVRMRGFVAPDLLGRRLAAYDALVHPSLHESQGMALIEAAFAGLPIACGAVGVARELLDLGAPIAIADDPSGPALARATLAAAEERAGEEACARVRARFSIDACARRFARTLEEAAS